MNFDTPSVRMERTRLFTVLAPEQDVDRVMKTVREIVSLAHGPYDCNAWVSAPGTERYRPLEGAAAGAETDVRERPGVVTVSFETPCDEPTRDRLVEAIFQVHSYQEPVIRIHDILTSRSKGLDDSTNPHRWWNTTGDWKRS